MNKSVIVRGEHPEDHAAIRFVNEEAFGRRNEADLVDGLRNQGVVLASFVAEVEKRVVGYILFIRMSIETTEEPVPAVALAPVAILLEQQGWGIGGRIIRHSLDWLRREGEQVVNSGAEARHT